MVLVALLDKESDTALLAGDDTDGLVRVVSFPLYLVSPYAFAWIVSSRKWVDWISFVVNVPCLQSNPRSGSSQPIVLKMQGKKDIPCGCRCSSG